MLTTIVWTILFICSALVIFGLVMPFVFAYRCEHNWQVTAREGRYVFKACDTCKKTKKEKLS